MSHYKLPLDEEMDKDIYDWINQFPRNKKGEMVRHAIRYYMAELGEGEKIKFPNSPVSKPSIPVEKPITQQAKQRKERVRPQMNADALK